MMHDAVDSCFANPAVQTVLIDPLPSNIRAIRFYERLGFCHVGICRLNLKEIAVMQIAQAGHRPAS